MEKMICASCGATVNPDPALPVLTCAYCDTTMKNPCYDGSAAAPAPSLDAQCVKALLDMGSTARLPADVFGAPLTEAYAAREALGIPDEEAVYFAFAHGTIWRTFSEGFALTESGLYYLSGGDSGKRSWEAFATGEASGTPCGGWGQEGVLRLGQLSFPLNSDDDNDAAEFLVDFHHRCYRLFTGDTAPAAWTLSAARAEAASGSIGKAVATATVAGTVLNAAGNLLRRAATPRTVQRPTLHHPAARQEARRPAPRQGTMARGPQERPAPRPARPMQHQSRSAHPAGAGRPGGMGHPGGRGPGGRGPGGPGRGRR